MGGLSWSPPMSQISKYPNTSKFATSAIEHHRRYNRYNRNVARERIEADRNVPTCGKVGPLFGGLKKYEKYNEKNLRKMSESLRICESFGVM